MNRMLLIALVCAAGCRVGNALNERIERNSAELYQIEKQRLADVAPAYDAERLAALKALTTNRPISAEVIEEATAVADKSPAGIAYRKQATNVEIAEYKLADASQRLGPPFGKTAKEMEIERQTGEDDRLIAALKSATEKH